MTGSTLPVSSTGRSTASFWPTSSSSRPTLSAATSSSSTSRRHKGKAVRRAIRAAGAKLFFLPPYSRDLNPIDGIRQLKLLCAKPPSEPSKPPGNASARSCDLHPQECANYFRNAGYASTGSQFLSLFSASVDCRRSARERVVRIVLASRIWLRPLTRPAVPADLSPQAGRGKQAAVSAFCQPLPASTSAICASVGVR